MPEREDEVALRIDDKVEEVVPEKEDELAL